MDGASKSPGRDRPRGGSSEGTEDTEGRHYRDRTRVEGEGCVGRFGIDGAVMTARDFVWLKLVIQTHDFAGISGFPRWIAPARDHSKPFLRDFSDLPTHELPS